MRYTIFKRLLGMGVVYILILTLLICTGLFAFWRHSLYERLGHEARIVAAFSTQTEADALEWQKLQIRAGNKMRLTIVQPDGTVVYESERPADGMSNHGQRPEVVEALATGEGYGSRTSETIGTSTYYYAARAANGNIIRVATEAPGIDFYLYGAFLVVFALSTTYLIGVYYMARRITHEIMRPIDEAFKAWTRKRGTKVLRRLSMTYAELDPLFELLEKQQDEMDRYIRQETERRREFSANIAHELRTPLTTISGYAEILKEGYVKSGDEAAVLGGKIYSSAKRMLDTVESILHLSEIEEHLWQSMLTDVDLRTVWERAVQSIRTKYGESVRLELSGEDIKVKGHEALLEELAYNLLDNAVKYGDETNRIRVRMEETDAEVRIIVSDTGRGIPKHKQERIFERFYRVDESREGSSRGNGIGLALVKHIVEIHEGSVRVSSAEGQGSIFTVVFPKK